MLHNIDEIPRENLRKGAVYIQDIFNTNWATDEDVLPSPGDDPQDQIEEEQENLQKDEL